MNRFGLFRRGPEAPSHETPPTQPKVESETPPEVEKTAAEKNKEIMIDAIAENFWNLGMTQGMGGSVEERKAAARSMAEEALGMVPSKYETLPTQELNQNKSFLVAEAVRLYQESKEGDGDVGAEEEALAAK